MCERERERGERDRQREERETDRQREFSLIILLSVHVLLYYVYVFVALHRASRKIGSPIELPSLNKDLTYLLTYLHKLVSSRYLKVKAHPKLLLSQSKFSGSRKFTLRYQKFQTTDFEF